MSRKDKDFDRFKGLVKAELGELTESRLMQCIANFNKERTLTKVIIEDGDIILMIGPKEALRLEKTIDGILTIMFNIMTVPHFRM